MLFKKGVKNLCVSIRAKRNMKTIVNAMIIRSIIVVMKKPVTKVNTENVITVKNSAIVVTDITNKKPSQRGLFIFFFYFPHLLIDPADNIFDCFLLL